MKPSKRAAGLYQELFASSPDGILLIDAETQRVTEFNDAACRQLGYTREEFARLRLSDYEASETPDEIDARVQKALREGKTEFDTLQRTKTGEMRHVHVWAKTVDLDGRMVFYAIFRDITERRQVDEALRESQQGLQAIVEGTTDAVYIKDAKGRYVLFNAAASRFAGVDPSVVIGRDDTFIFPPDEARVVMEGDREVMASGTVRTYEERVTTANGQQTTFLSTKGPLFDANGNTFGLFGIARDITDDKQATERVMKSEARYRALTESATVAIITADRSGNIAGWNHAAEITFGYTAAEIIGQPLTLLMPHRYRERHLSGINRLQSGGEPRLIGKTLELEGLRKDQSEFPMELSLARWETSEGWFVTGIVNDITDRVQTQAELSKLRMAVNASHEVIFMTDMEGIIRFVNPAFTDLYGYAAAEVVGKTTPRILKNATTPREAYESFWNSILSKQVVTGEIINRTRDGRLLTIESSANPILNEQGKSIGFLAIQHDITERKQVEATLYESEVRYRGLFQANPHPMWVYDLETLAFLQVNDAAVAHYGYRRDEFLAMTIADIRPTEDVPRLLADIAHIDDDVTGEGSVWSHRKKDGSIIDVEITAHAIDYGGRQARLVLAHDITVRRRVEKALRTREAELKDAQRVSHVGSWDRVLETGAIAWSEELCRIYGVDPKLPIPAFEDLAQFYTPESWARLRAAVEKALQGGAPIDLDVQIVRTDGKVIWVATLGEVVRDTAGQIVGTRGTIHDITERKRAEEALAQLNQQHELILCSAAEGILGLDVQGNHTFVNPVAARMLGYEAEKLLGRPSHSTWHHTKADGSPYPREECQIYSAYRDGQVHRVSNEVFWRKDGTSLPVEYASTPIYEQGRLSGAVVTFTDITERLQLEAQFHQAQKMESVGQLASGIAHDFNNLLTVINGMSQLVLAQVSQDNPVHADVQEILHAGERAATLTRQLLAFSRQQILAPRVLNFNTVVAGMESLLRRLLGEDIDLVVVLTPDVGNVKADPGQIEQVITNLAVNARDAMPRGGRLTIEMQNVTVDEDSARQHGVAMPPGSYVRLAVSDSGVGMDEATRARIFEPFFTTKGPGKGTGLGLSTVYGIVTQSHGFLWVDSKVGRGTSFKIFLPQVTEAAGTDRSGPTVMSSSGTETILLVEDDAGLRKLATRVLEPAGYTVLGAATGEEALRLLERHEEPVHLLLSDVVMPGMSGRQLAEQLAQTRPGMKVLYMSGYTDDTIVRHGVLKAQVTCLNKPFTAATLLRKVREGLDS